MTENDAAASPLYAAPAQPLRLGIIGLGGIAQSSHLPSLALLQSWGWPVSIVALADPGKEQIAKTLHKFACSTRLGQGDLIDASVQTYPNGASLLAAGVIDAVLILTPPSVTAPLLSVVLSRNVPALAEKPVATNAEILADLVDEESRIQGAPLVRIAYNRRSQPLAIPFRDRLNLIRTSDATGALHFEARLWRSNRNDRIFYDDTMVHSLDFLLWCLGPLEVQNVQTWPPQKPGDLAAGIRVTFRTVKAELPSITAQLDVRPAVGRDVESYNALGATESLEMNYPLSVRGIDRARLTHYKNNAGTEYLCNEAQSRDYDPEGLIVRGFLPQLAAFLRLVADGSREANEPELCTLTGAHQTALLKREVMSRI